MKGPHLYTGVGAFPRPGGNSERVEPMMAVGQDAARGGAGCPPPAEGAPVIIGPLHDCL